MQPRRPVPEPHINARPRVVIFHIRNELCYCLDKYCEAVGIYRTEAINRAIRKFLEDLPDGKGYAKPSQFSSPQAHQPQDETPSPTRLDAVAPIPLGGYDE